MCNKKLIQKTIESGYPGSVDIFPISNSAYKVRNREEGEEWYAKMIPAQKFALVAELVAINSGIGMPESKMIDGEICIQLMRPAEGQQLSRALLWHLAPLVWSVKQKQIKTAFNNLGQNLGTLHKQTQKYSNKVIIDDLHMDKYDSVVSERLDSVLNDVLNDKIISILNDRIFRYSGSEQPVSIVHGDLMLFHIYVSGNHVSIIDFDRAKRAHPIEDVATFQSALDLFVRRLPYGRQTQFDQLISAFNDGYNTVVSEWQIDTQRVTFFQALRHCSLLLYYLDKVDEESSLKLRMLKRYDVPKLKHAISDLVGKIAQEPIG